MAYHGVPRAGRIALVAVLPVLLLVQGCAAEVIFWSTMLAVDAADNASREAARESALQHALAARNFAYPHTVVCTRALVQAAQRDGRRIESGYPQSGPMVVSYPAAPSIDTAGGKLVVECHRRGYTGRDTTVIVVNGGAGSDEASREVAEQLLDALAVDVDDIARQVVGKTFAADVKTVFDALGRVGASQGRQVVAIDAATHSLRVSFPYFVEGRSAQGMLDVACLADSGQTTVTITGDGKSPDLDVRKAADAVLADLVRVLGLPERPV